MPYKTIGNVEMVGFKYIGILELEEHDTYFEVYANDEYVVFGGACNVGFIESGHYKREEYQTLDESIQELHTDLEVLYQDGKHYTSDNFDCNDRV